MQDHENAQQISWRDIGYDGNGTETEIGEVSNNWAIVLKEDAEKSLAEHAEWATSLQEEDHEGFDGQSNVFDLTAIGIHGYSGEFSDHVIDIIRRDKDVSWLNLNFRVDFQY